MNSKQQSKYNNSRRYTLYLKPNHNLSFRCESVRTLTMKSLSRLKAEPHRARLAFGNGSKATNKRIESTLRKEKRNKSSVFHWKHDSSKSVSEFNVGNMRDKLKSPSQSHSLTPFVFYAQPAFKRINPSTRNNSSRQRLWLLVCHAGRKPCHDCSNIEFPARDPWGDTKVSFCWNIYE